MVEALPPPSHNASSAILDVLGNNSTSTGSVLSKVLTTFPPGPPPPLFFYAIPDTDIAIRFAPLGHIPHRNETLMKKVVRDAFYVSLSKRSAAKMPGHGYQLQERECLIGVNHSVGMSSLTWSLWTIVLTGMTGYVRAYPGFDFMFEVEELEEEALEGVMIAAGFAMTRG